MTEKKKQRYGKIRRKCISDDVIYPEIKENGLFKCYWKMAHFENRTKNMLEEEIKL